MARTKPNYQEEAGFDESLLRKPLRSQIERESSGPVCKVLEPMYPVLNDSMEHIDNAINEDICAAENGGKELSVENQHTSYSLETKVKIHLSASYRESRRSPSREKDSSASSPPDKNDKVRRRKTMKHADESRKSPDREEDPPKLSTLNKNSVKPSRKSLQYDKLPKPNKPNTVKASPGPGNKYKLEYTSDGTIYSISKEAVVMKIVFVLLLIFGAYAIRQTLYSASHENRVTFNYQSIVSNFQHSFKGQPDNSFKIFKSALRSINKTDPSAPAVILFLASKGAEEIASSLGEKLVHSVSSSPIKISGKEYEKLNSDSGKKFIDEALRSMNTYVSDEEYGAVLVKDLHRIPGETALMFHTYCDNENAPYKHAVYVLIVHMEEPIPVNSKIKDWDMSVYKRLNRAWSDIDEDQRGPLLSRLTVSVAAII